LGKKNLITARRDYLEFELNDKYLQIDKLIGQRRHELERLYEVKHLTVPGIDDTGASGSGTFVNRSENLAVAYASDPMVLRLENFQTAISKLLDALEPDDKKIFHDYRRPANLLSITLWRKKIRDIVILETFIIIRMILLPTNYFIKMQNITGSILLK